MSNVYESIMTGLNEALEDAKNTRPIVKRHKVMLGSGLFSHSESEKNDQSQSIYNRQYIRLWLFTVTI